MTAASSSTACTIPLGPLGSPARAPNHRALRALQQRVLDQALERLADCLASPCDRAREVCVELGVAHGDLEAAFRRRQQGCLGEQRLDGDCEAPSQVRPWHNNLATFQYYIQYVTPLRYLLPLVPGTWYGYVCLLSHGHVRTGHVRTGEHYCSTVSTSSG